MACERARSILMQILRKECNISVDHLYKCALRKVEDIISLDLSRRLPFLFYLKVQLKPLNR